MKNDLSDQLGQPSRRDFIRIGAATAIGASLPQVHAESPDDPPSGRAATMINVPFQKVTPRIGIIGTGGRGTNLLENLLGADAKVLALCDIVPEKAQHAQ